MDFITVNVPHQSLKGFRRKADVYAKDPETTKQFVGREMKTLQERFSAHYASYREEYERHRLNLLTNLQQMNRYWFEADCFEKSMFRFRGAWTNFLLDKSLNQVNKTIAEELKDLWSMKFEIDYICDELTDRLILDDSIPLSEKTNLSEELYRFKQNAGCHVLEVDHFSNEVRQLLAGKNLRKLRGLTKAEYKSNIDNIIETLEKAKLPFRAFKTVGFSNQTRQISPSDEFGEEDLVSTPSCEPDYPDDT